MPNQAMQARFDVATLLTHLNSDFPKLEFTPGTRFSWHAGQQRISYRQQANTTRDAWALLHEVGHALLAHATYNYDLELIQLEALAWSKARDIAERYGLHIDDNYIQDCLDTYRDWLHLRATCPTCFARSPQTSSTRYRCFNCQSEWRVTRSRLCRPYRRKQNSAESIC